MKNIYLLYTFLDVITSYRLFSNFKKEGITEFAIFTKRFQYTKISLSKAELDEKIIVLENKEKFE